MAESIRRSYREFVGAVADVLDSLDIQYGIAGSFASSHYGEPRQTLDVDLTLHLQPVDAERFAAAFEAIQMMLANMNYWDKPLDAQYITQWATALQVSDYWNKLWDDFRERM